MRNVAYIFLFQDFLFASYVTYDKYIFIISSHKNFVKGESTSASQLSLILDNFFWINLFLLWGLHKGEPTILFSSFPFLSNGIQTYKINTVTAQFFMLFSRWLKPLSAHDQGIFSSLFDENNLSQNFAKRMCSCKPALREQIEVNQEF